MYLPKLVRAGVLLAAIVSGAAASAQQQNTDNQLKEVQLGSGAFTLGGTTGSVMCFASDERP